MITEIPGYIIEQNMQKIRDYHYAIENAERRLAVAKAEYEAEVDMITARLNGIAGGVCDIPTTDGWVLLPPSTPPQRSAPAISKSPLVSQYE